HVLQHLANKFRCSAKRFVCITSEREETAQEHLLLPYVNDLHTTPRNEGAHFLDSAVDQDLRTGIPRGSDEVLGVRTARGAGRLPAIKIQYLVFALACEPIA